MPEATPPPRLTPPRSPRARRPTYRSLTLFQKKCGQNQSSYPRPPLFRNIHSRKKSSPLLRLIHHKYRHAAVAVDCRSVSLSGPTVRRNASITISTARHDRGRGLRCCGSTRLGNHALAGLLFNLGQSVRGFGRHPGFNIHSGRLGRRWGRFSLPGWFGESAQPIRLWRRLRRFLVGP